MVILIMNFHREGSVFLEQVWFSEKNDETFDANTDKAYAAFKNFT